MNSCFVSFTSCVLGLTCFCQIHLHLLYLYLFWRANQMTKNRRRFVSRTFVVFYGGFL